jgi:hypothetical protein
MIASSPPARSVMVTTPAQSLPRTVDAFVGSLLELVIHSIEGVRERLGKLALRSTD